MKCANNLFKGTLGVISSMKMNGINGLYEKIGLIVPLHACLLVISAYKFIWFSWQCLLINLSTLKMFMLTWIPPVCGERVCAFSFKDVSYEYIAHFFNMFLGLPKKETIGLQSRWSVYSWYYSWHAPCTLPKQ